jgi:hypothetical protein
MTSFADTPWDEPSGRSPEFQAYIANEYQRDDPWNRIAGPELCKSRR